MKRVLTAVVLIPIVLVIVFAAPRWLFAAVAAVFGMAALHEYLNIVAAHGYRPLRRATLALLALLFVGLIAAGFGYDALHRTGHPVQAAQRMRDLDMQLLLDLSSTLTTACLLVGPLVLLGLAMRESDLKQSLPVAATSALGLMYIGLPFWWFTSLHFRDGAFFTVFVFLVVWSGDIAAFYVGRRWGRMKLAPHVSPNKTWEGAVASVIAAAAIALLFYGYSDRLLQAAHLYLGGPPSRPFPHPLWLAGIAAVVGNIAAQVGDLAESALKRGAGIKDSGTILPGHGGVLDRIDALLFAAPVLSYYPLAITLFRQ